MAEKFFLYIDDSGNRFPDKQDPICRDDGMDHFALGGVLIKEGEKERVKQKYVEFCDVWNIDYPLHSTDIRGARGNFAWLEGSVKQNDKFFKDLDDFLTNLPAIGFASVVHRPGYNTRYEEKHGDKRWWMCKTAYSILIERVTKYLQKKDGVLEIRFEECGKKEDRAIIQYSKDLKNIGSPFNNDSSIKYDALTQEIYQSMLLGEPRRRKKENLFLQIADLYLYPMAKYGYQEDYRPWHLLFEQKKIINALLLKKECEFLGIKYSCFDMSEKSKRPG